MNNNNARSARHVVAASWLSLVLLMLSSKHSAEAVLTVAVSAAATNGNDNAANTSLPRPPKVLIIGFGPRYDHQK